MFIRQKRETYETVKIQLIGFNLSTGESVQSASDDTHCSSGVGFAWDAEFALSKNFACVSHP